MYIKLTNSKLVVAVDDDCTPELFGLEWRLVGAYAVCGGLFLHKAVLGLGDMPARVITVDHINGDTMDCRRANLRVATQSQNQHNARKRKDNKTGVKGVSRDKAGLFEVRIKLEGKQRFGGRFATLEAAEQAAIELRAKLHGRFANHG